MVGLDNPLHIAFLLVILLLVFGAKRLPEMGRSLGSGLRGFKETISGEGASEHHEAVTTASTAGGEHHAAEPVRAADEPLDTPRAA